MLNPGLAEIFAPDGVSGSDIMENFRESEVKHSDGYL